MQSLSAGDLTISAAAPDDGVVRLDWIGKSNDRQPTKILQPFFVTVAAVAKQHNAIIEMHFEKLEHFNSSTITALIQFIQALRADGTQLVIVFSGQLKWQKLSFEALRIFEKPDGLLSFRVL